MKNNFLNLYIQPLLLSLGITMIIGTFLLHYINKFIKKYL